MSQNPPLIFTNAATFSIWSYYATPSQSMNIT